MDRILSEIPRALVVDDDKDMRDIICSLLCSDGIEVMEASNGLDALRLIKNSTPDIVLLDVGLPDISGLQVFVEMRSDKQIGEVPVIFVTGETNFSDRISGHLGRITRYLKKPFSGAELFRQVRSTLEADNDIGRFRRHRQQLSTSQIAWMECRTRVTA
jgi:DNA-binding response OmpR family regulator